MRPFTLVIAAWLLTFYNAVGQKLPSQTKAKANRPNGVAAIVGRCAVIVRPGNRKIAQMKRSNLREDYAASVNDNEYYVGASIAFLDSAKVRRLARPAQGVLIFKTTSGQFFRVPLADVYWGIFLFNGRTRPIEADVTDIGASYQAYMRK